MTPADVSLYVIVRDNPNIAVCLAQFRPYVKEIVVVDTGSTDDVTVDLAKTVADRVEIFTACNDESGQMDDFALARNYAMQLTHLPSTYWTDSDDTVTGLENLAEEYDHLITMRQRSDMPACLHYAYECSWEADGRPRDRPYRERLVSNKTAFAWKGRVHECLPPIHGLSSIVRERRSAIVHTHRPVFSAERQGRNVRLLEKMLREEGSTPQDRTLYCLGCELRRPSQKNAARAKELFTSCLTQSTSSISADRRINILCHLFELALENADPDGAMSYATGARILHEAGNPSPLWHAREWEPGFGGFLVAVAHLALGFRDNSKSEFRLAVAELETAKHLRQNSTIDEPLNRIIAHQAIRHFHLAYAALGETEKAIASCKEAMELRSFDQNVVKMLPQYERSLGLEPSIAEFEVGAVKPEGAQVEMREAR
jgi:hypothetical protein